MNLLRVFLAISVKKSNLCHMKLDILLLACVFAVALIGCNSAQEPSFSPSLTDLKADETLIMKYNACHRGCTKAIIKFSNSEAIFKRHRLKLSEDEIADLNDYFNLGRSPDKGWGCSLLIEISFELKRSFQTLKIKEMQIYPCSSERNKVGPEKLVTYFTEYPNDIPFWRLSDEELSNWFERNRHAIQ
jgi:hypothetical protein